MSVADAHPITAHNLPRRIHSDSKNGECIDHGHISFLPSRYLPGETEGNLSVAVRMYGVNEL